MTRLSNLQFVVKNLCQQQPLSSAAYKQYSRTDQPFHRFQDVSSVQHTLIPEYPVYYSYIFGIR
jgi:hypothetical protein